MRLLTSSLLFLFIGFQVCTAQSKANQKITHIEEFNWTIAIPENFTPIRQIEWGKIIEKSIDFQGEDILNQEATVFAYQNNKFNKFIILSHPEPFLTVRTSPKERFMGIPEAMPSGKYLELTLTYDSIHDGFWKACHTASHQENYSRAQIPEQ